MSEDNAWMYEYILQTIRSPEFRNPIKDFIDDNCNTFIGLEENTFEQGELHKQFVQLIDNLLDTITKDIGITEEMFCMAAKKGLNDPKAKKYFEQLISFTNYNYFKNLMTKRNFQLEELAYKQMMADKNENEDEEELEKKRKEMEENELQCALKMSLAAEEEKKKLEELEDEELQKAIQLSLKEQQAKEEPSLLAQMQPSNTQSQQTKKEKKKEEPKKMEDIQKETDKKLNPVDKVALKQKMLLEHDKKMKNLANQNLPNFSAGNENLNKKLNEFEQNKAQKLQEYREMILKMKKEKRQKEENELDDILKVGGPGAEGQPKLSEEEQKKLNMRKQLAERLKAKNKAK